MSNVRKTYKLKYMSRQQTYVRVNGKVCLVEFRNTNAGNPESRGTFTTSNPDIIKAMESDSGFNKIFVVDQELLVKEIEIESLPLRADPIEVKKLRLEEETKQRLSESEIALREKEAVKEVIFDPVVTNSTENVSEETIESEVVPMDICKNVQEVKSYLKNLYPELTARQVINKQLVFDVAKEKGIRFAALEQ